MSSIYIHIPFCESKCHYCNFFSQASQRNKDAFLGALLKEIELSKHFLQNKKIQTIYFGGGTPSVLSPAEITTIIETLAFVYDLSAIEEITLEANPEHLTESYLQALSLSAVNRLSIGAQSFADEALVYLGRGHSAQRALEAVQTAKMYVANISVDLIIGIPLSKSVIESDVHTLISLDVPHISAYALTIEDRTPLRKMIEDKKKAAVNEEQTVKELEYVMQLLSGAGYEQYEISNFAKVGKESIHNSNYWNDTHYLGLGPSAHSYNGDTRQWNVHSMSDYIQDIAKGHWNFTSELLTPQMKLNEYILTAIRTSKGISLQNIRTSADALFFQEFAKQLDTLVVKGYITIEADCIKLSNAGKLMSDAVTVALMQA